MSAVIANWVVQGALAMDTSERTFKLAFELVVMAMLFVPLTFVLPYAAAAVAAAFCGHTIGWIFYGEKFVALKNVGLKISPKTDVDDYLSGLRNRVVDARFLALVQITGSYAAGRYREFSDVDVRVLRQEGFRNGVRACLWAMRERTKATFSSIPLDLLVFDSQSRYERRVPDARVLILLDRRSESFHKS